MEWKWKRKRVLLFCTVGLLLCAGTICLPWKLIIVSGSSMEPAYHSGEIILARKAGFCRNVPFARGEVVLFRHQDENYLKRVYAVPGDEVVIFLLDDESNVLIKAGEYLRYYQLAGKPGPGRIHRIEIGEDELFLLGDAPHLSLDSRDFGPVPQSTVIARIF